MLRARAGQHQRMARRARLQGCARMPRAGPAAPPSARRETRQSASTRRLEATAVAEMTRQPPRNASAIAAARGGAAGTVVAQATRRSCHIIWASNAEAATPHAIAALNAEQSCGRSPSMTPECSAARMTAGTLRSRARASRSRTMGAPRRGLRGSLPCATRRGSPPHASNLAASRRTATRGSCRAASRES